MRLNEIKKGFWGFQKNSVYTYIDEIEKEYSLEIIRVKESFDDHLTEYREQITALTVQKQELEEQVNLLKHQIEEESKLRKKAEQTANELMLFKQRAQSRAESFKESRSQKEPPEKDTEPDPLEPGHYSSEEEWETWLDRQIQEIQAGKEQVGSQNMKLFQRRE